MNPDFVRSRTSGHPMPEVVLRTRRSVMEAAQQMHLQRRRQRRQLGYALLALGTLIVLSAPALWSAYSDLASGEQLTDLPVMMLVLSLVMLSAMFAVFLVSWRGKQRDANEDRR